MHNKNWFQILIVTCLIACDRWTKWWIVHNIPLGKSRVVNGILKWVHVRNKGISFGLLARPVYGERLLVLFLILLGLCWILYLYKISPPTGRIRYALILILGGAIGNLIDRLIYGAVVDFIHLHAYGYAWPAFNFADIYLTLGFVLIVLAFSQKA